ncbi:hypothetical protein [Smaragdicoccus niigatensis]|uniref:hypothetical protein n=1 Tax=Smaragdicoccus niigatensis TaxID=359359 RepID=UPI0003630A9E|nr:hypothetical protein [Smaragdicoccus niigatensis]
MTESVQLLATSGCPSHEEAHTRLLALLHEIGRPDVRVDVVWIESPELAANIGFIGSPTFRIGGSDILPPDPNAPTGLNCRVYQRRDGRFSPLPDPDDLRDAVTEALA